jgi:hypothetical protein
MKYLLSFIFSLLFSFYIIKLVFNEVLKTERNTNIIIIYSKNITIMDMEEQQKITHLFEKKIVI